MEQKSTSGQEALPKLSLQDAWLKEQKWFQWEDMWLMDQVNPDSLDRVKSFHFDAEDILVCTYPRSGTTWSQELTWLVINDVDIETASQTDLDVRSPFIEFTAPYGMRPEPDVAYLENTLPPRIIKTHFFPQIFDKQRREVGFRTIIVMRNLRDVMVSHFHFYRDMFRFTGTWDDFFELFKSKKMLYGDWAQHCLKCWQLRDNPKVLILKYEEIKRQPEDIIKKLADFCGKTLSEEQVTTIADYTLLDNMKKRGALFSNHPNKDKFIRKGTVGGWKAYFTEEQSKCVTQYLKDTTEQQGLSFE